MYKVAKHPKEKKWYVVGHTGGGIYIPVSHGYKTKREAQKHIKHQILADRAAKKELAYIQGKYKTQTFNGRWQNENKGV